MCIKEQKFIILSLLTVEKEEALELCIEQEGQYMILYRRREEGHGLNGLPIIG